ncbi:VQ motif-containing protein 18-like [Prunus avium]|uniref:VQ motif-containing protein 18-like n=1 Tax=Prunus avium TaxID=42229 RepID=A0A6P5SHQ4_PRUAV|nr:VQ motif-containing protein 18-like [Prunus avium]
MEKMMKKPQYSSCNPSSASSKLGMHKESHKMWKTASKPKIRIIHVFAPEIIKTDVANFRELVQNLTGKPAAAPEVVNGSRKKTIRCSTYSSPGKKILELQNDGDQRVKEEIQNYTWRSSSSGDHQPEKINSFLDGFSDLDGFIEDLSTESPSLHSSRSSAPSPWMYLDMHDQ